MFFGKVILICTVVIQYMLKFLWGENLWIGNFYNFCIFVFLCRSSFNLTSFTILFLIWTLFVCAQKPFENNVKALQCFSMTPVLSTAILAIVQEFNLVNFFELNFRAQVFIDAKIWAHAVFDVYAGYIVNVLQACT